MRLLAISTTEFAREANEFAARSRGAGHTLREIELSSSSLDELFALAPKFDRVHLFGGSSALACALSVDAPVVFSASSKADAAELELARRAAPNVALVERERHAAPELAHALGDHDVRPWGEYWVLADDPTFKLKRIDVLAHKRLSYQKHAKRAEHWIVVRGLARVTLDGRTIDLQAGQTIDIPTGAAHRMENRGDARLTFVEIQTGSYFGEDDIVRLEDDFGR